MSPKVSIIIAAYNIEKYIQECIESVLSQTYKNIEIIIIDDGSTDNTPKICDIFSKNNKQIKVVHQNNKGLSISRNNGIKESSGEYIIFIDGDDKVNKNFVEKMVKNIEGSDIAVCGYKFFPVKKSDKMPKNEKITGREAAKRLLIEQENFQIVSWNKIYKKALFNKIKFPANKKNEDSFTTYKIFYEAKTVKFINDELYMYRQQDNSIMHTSKKNELFKNKREAAEEAYEYFKDDVELKNAAQISRLLAEYTFIDNIIFKTIEEPIEPHINWIKNNKKQLKNIPFLSKKLNIYITMTVHFNGIFYKLFRTFFSSNK